MSKALTTKQLQAKKIRLTAELTKVADRKESIQVELDSVQALLQVEALKLRKEADDILGDKDVAVPTDAVGTDSEEETF